MKLLFIAPQPFYQERGTPIAVKLLLEALINYSKNHTPNKEADKLEIDLITYHEGSEINLEGVNHIRISNPFAISGITPGISIKKIICDIIITLTCLKLVIKKRYDLIHAVEEAGFIAYFIHLFFKIPYIYDIDSNLIDQLCQRWRWFRPFTAFAEFLEKRVIKNSAGCVAMCEELVGKSRQSGASLSFLLSDVALPPSSAKPEISLRNEFKIQDDTMLSLYVGNLEHYQGIDLMIESFKEACDNSQTKIALVIIGGPQYQEHYQKLAKEIKATNIFFAGPRAVGALPFYLEQADILLSPRTKGNNTPMKIYSYLAAGKAIIATRLATHTQVLNDENAFLVAAEKSAFAAAITKIIADRTLRHKLSSNARATAMAKYTIEKFNQNVAEIYKTVSQQIDTAKITG